MPRTPVLWVLGSLLLAGACSYEKDPGLNGPVPVLFGASQAGAAGSDGKTPAAAGKPGSGGRGSSGSASNLGKGGATRPTGGRESVASAGSTPANPGGCQPGTARCDAVEPVLRTCDDSGSWQVETCPFVCRAGACAGECQPGERTCDELQALRCNDFGAWLSDGQVCSLMCERGACTGTCTDGERQCASASTEQTCGDNVWGVPTPCPFTCVDGSCGGECEPGATRCPSATEVQTCSSAGTWATRSACDFVCAEGVCSGECNPGDARCAGADLEECAVNGQWNRVTTCPNTCVDRGCGGECRPGAQRCGSAENELELCSAEARWVASPCPDGGACSGDACVFPKVVFVTSELFDGNLGGVSGADQKCQELADRAGISGQFLALVNEPGRTIFERFDGDGGPYQLTDGTLVANHFEELGNTLGPLALTETGATPSEPDLDDLSEVGRAELGEKCRERRLESLVWCNAPVTGVGKDICSNFSRTSGELGASFCDWNAPDWDRPCGVTTPADDEGYCRIRAPLVCVQR